MKLIGSHLSIRLKITEIAKGKNVTARGSPDPELIRPYVPFRFLFSVCSFEEILISALFYMDKTWRPRPESNRGTRICNPLRHHSATWPLVKDGVFVERIISERTPKPFEVGVVNVFFLFWEEKSGLC